MNLKKINPFEVYRGLPGKVYVLFAATVINGMGIFVYPFLALFLTQKLGYSVADAGLFMFLASLLYVPGNFLGGKLSDRFGRRTVLLVSQSMASAAFLVCGFLGNSPLIPFILMVNLFFDGAADPARGAMQTDVTTTENRQSAFALTYLGHNLGYAVGPVIGGLLFERATNWLFIGNACAGFLSMLCIVLFVGETKPTKEACDESMKGESTDKAVEGSLLDALRERWALLLFGVFVSLYGFAYGQTLFSLPLSAVDAFGADGPKLFGALMALNAITVIVMNAPIVSFTRRFKTLHNVAFAGVLYTIGFAGFIFARSVPLFFVFTFIWTMGEVVDSVNTWYYIANNTPMSHRGRFGGIFPFVTGAGRSLAPCFGGMIIQRAGLAVLWLVASCTTLLTAGGICVHSRRRLPSGKESRDISGEKRTEQK
jgi:MFS family permease